MKDRITEINEEIDRLYQWLHDHSNADTSTMISVSLSLELLEDEREELIAKL